MSFTKTSVLIRFVCCATILFLVGINTGFPQATDSNWLDVSKVRFQKLLSKHCEYAEGPKKLMTAGEIISQPFQKRDFKTLHPGIPLHLIEKNFMMRIQAWNSSDSMEEFYFTPGYYARNLVIFKADPSDIAGTVHQIPDSTNRSTIYSGCRLLKLAPGEKAVYYVSLNFIRTNANSFSPYFIEKDFLRYWLKNVKHRNPLADIITYIIAGILLLMIFYSLAVYLQSRNKEFIFYSIYALCSTILFFVKSYAISESNEWNYLYEEYLDFMIMGLGVYFYLIFVRRFINTKEDHPSMEKFLRIAQWILVGFLGIFSIIYFFTDQFVILYILENYIIKVFMFGIGVVFVWYSLKKKDKLLNYLAAGNFALLAFSVVSLLLLLGVKFNKSGELGSIFNNGLLYYEVGIVLELMFFLSGLAYKNRRDLTERVQERERFKLENERKEFEKQIAIVTTRQEERDRISADMHDELGSGMTAIRLMSEIVRTRMKDQAFPELEKISNSANDLLGKMNSIIWTMKSSNDTLESLVAYLRSHALEYFESTPIVCRVQVPEHIPPTVMSGEKRRNIFLSVKESLNNILKHAHATEVTIQIILKEKQLIIKVSDNGVGIDTEKLRRFGNGLSNMKRRMESIQGDFMVENDRGSVITFMSPL